MDRAPPSDASKAEKLTRGRVRESRLKVALKANMAKRKAQVRARSGTQTTGTQTAGETGPEENEG
ncbi:MAG: hypothetical protein ABIV25_00990 [Paracoccaceae bacterium]